MSLRYTQSGHTETHYGIHSQCLIWLSQEEYFRALAKSPAVLGMRKMSKDGKIIYTSPELKKIDQILDKARSGLAHLESLPHSANSFYYLLLIDNPEKVHFFFHFF